jgi:Na+-driven multidrug efflux pump
MVQGFYIGPLWSAYSAKYLEKDFDWIQKTIKKSLLITLFLYLCILITISVFNHILNIWIGNSDYYNFDLIVAIAIYVSVRLWSSNFSTLLNGLSLTHLQLKTSIAATLLNIPLSIYLVKYTSLGIAGIAYGSAISLSIFAVIAPFYTYKILKRESYK